MNVALTGVVVLAGLALARPRLQVDHIVVLAERPSEAAAPAGASAGGQTQSPQKPTSTPKGGSTMR